MSPNTIVLRHNPSLDDDSWEFSFPIPRSPPPGMGKHISFSPESITFSLVRFPENRIIHSVDLGQFVLVSFGRLRFSERPGPSATRDYMIRLFEKGLVLNGERYGFYGHSNSQLRSRSCFMRKARTDEELDERIYSYGDFTRIMNVAKRAKRIGLLFSEAKIDWTLDPRWTKDIGDITVNGENFSDGCGLISKKFSMMLAKRKRLLFHGRPYTPCVLQIRYKGYKGVLMLHPELEEDHIHFRASQKKFTATVKNTFSVVDHSTPYAFGRLNNDVVVLLSSLGVSSEKLLAKQVAYHRWIHDALTDWTVAFDLLCATNNYPLAECLLLKGLDNPTVQSKIKGVQGSELSAFKKNEKFRTRTLVAQSRLLFGVCDPYGVLKEGQVHVRVSVPRKGATTLKSIDVLVVRNPCLHPGDCLKLRAVDHPRLGHLVDCIVFASKGRRAAPSMSSGGDLDGDKFLVIWDPDLVPAKVAESYTYPPGKEHTSKSISRQDLAGHFAAYNSVSLGRITTLHAKWVRCSPRGAMSDECQDLNALHSLAVDGGRVKIPDRLLSPPEATTPYIIDLLADAAKAFAESSLQEDPEIMTDRAALLHDQDDAEEMLARLLAMENPAVSEYEIVKIALSFARKHHLDMRQHLSHIDFGALTVSEKYAISLELGLTPENEPFIWNSLIRSEILQPQDLEGRNLGGPLRLQKLYSSSEQGRAAFFEYLRRATQYYTRRVLILKTDDRFSIGVFLRGPISWDDEAELNENVVVSAFMPKASGLMSTYRTGVKGYTLHCGENIMQLFNRQRANSFIFVTRPPEKSGVDIITSIALQNISRNVQQQIGRVLRTPVSALEIHVVSNRDRIAHQAFDLRFQHVQTEEYLSRFDHTARPFIPYTLHGFDWSTDPGAEGIFTQSLEQARRILSDASLLDLYKHFKFAIKYRCEDRIFLIFDILLAKEDIPVDQLETYMDAYPSLVYCVLKKFLPAGFEELPDTLAPLGACATRNIIRSANHFGIAALAALERLSLDIAKLDLASYSDMLWWTAHSIRPSQLFQETLICLHEARAAVKSHSDLSEYTHSKALGITFDRAEEAADTCPCDESGRPKRQRTSPIHTKLRLPKAAPDEDPNPEIVLKTVVLADIRVDAQTNVRLHSHVRLKVASPAETSTLPAAIVDAVVTRASRGELSLDVKHPLPPEWDTVDWLLYDAGSTATSKAMLDAVQTLSQEEDNCCAFTDIITGIRPESSPIVDADEVELVDQIDPTMLNRSQRAAVSSARPGRLTLIWGPPGTGKTTVVVHILLKILREDSSSRILMTASTHNAVDNVLERFLVENSRLKILQDDQILRVATESSKVNKSLQKYTIDARIGGSLIENPKLLQQAQKRVKEARIVFTTCTGAGLGILRKAEYETVLIDEASQITEPCALIPLVKGCKRAVLVGDHVQLRPTVRPMSKALEFDRSLFERLYTGPHHPQMSRTMLDVQYRFPTALASFPSREFYENRLETGMNDETTRQQMALLQLSAFPWPSDGGPNGDIFPLAFIPCSAEEDVGRASKSNKAQADLVQYIISLLRSPHPNSPESEDTGKKLQDVSIAVLSPYSAQVKLLKQNLPTTIVVSTIDGFQGREADIVIFTTVRSNMEGDLGFVDDPRRLNVAWTRARKGLIVVGSRGTLEMNCPLWKRALAACREILVVCPVADEE